MSYGYQDLACSARHGWEPEMEQELFPDIAPCPIWLVPPGFRVARLSDLSTAAGRTPSAAQPAEAEALLQHLGIAYASSLLLTGPWQGPVATWKNRVTEDSYVLWQTGRR
ncbi:MAG: hypothetical protein NVSMB38_30520 [Ktedonobacteraceae bacterium]